MNEIGKGSKLTCSKCSMEVGELVVLENVELVRIRGVILRYAHGFCIECGTEFHWSVSDRMLKRIIERAQIPSFS